jgi:hypothetical protein
MWKEVAVGYSSTYVEWLRGSMKSLRTARVMSETRTGHTSPMEARSVTDLNQLARTHVQTVDSVQYNTGIMKACYPTVATGIYSLMNSHFQYISFILTHKYADSNLMCAQICLPILNNVTSCYPVVMKFVTWLVYVSEPYRPVHPLANFVSLSGFKLGTSLMHTHGRSAVHFTFSAAQLLLVQCGHFLLHRDYCSLCFNCLWVGWYPPVYSSGFQTKIMLQFLI